MQKSDPLSPEQLKEFRKRWAESSTRRRKRLQKAPVTNVTPELPKREVKLVADSLGRRRLKFEKSES